MQLGAYFGIPAVNLTRWQVLYYRRLLETDPDPVVNAVYQGMGFMAGAVGGKRR